VHGSAAPVVSITDRNRSVWNQPCRPVGHARRRVLDSRRIRCASTVCRERGSHRTGIIRDRISDDARGGRYRTGVFFARISVTRVENFYRCPRENRRRFWPNRILITPEVVTPLPIFKPTAHDTGK
jgi:hypothetical protein